MRTFDYKPRRASARLALSAFATLLALLWVLIAHAGSAPAQDAASELQGKLDELSQLQAQEGPLRERIDAANAQVNALIGRESVLRQQRDAVQARLDAQQAKLDQAAEELAAARTELQQTRARLERALAQLSSLLVEIYKNGDPDTLSVVLGSASWSDVLSEADYLDRIQNHDELVATRVKQLRDQIAAAVVQLRGVRDTIRKARNEVAVERNKVAAAHKQVADQHAQLVAARQQRQGDLEALLARERSLQKDIIPSSAPPGGTATIVNGEAIAPANAPLAVKAAIAAANRINDRPYVWGGGHGSFESSGYDCSGAVSYALHGGGLLSSPLDSSGFQVWGAPGGGSWITVYANSGHAYAVIAGLRWDTSGTGSSGPRWQTSPVSTAGSPSGFIARHPPGL